MRKLVMLALIVAATFIVIPLAMAQGEGQAAPVGLETTFAWTVAAWFIYAMAGILANVAFGTEPFDAKKLAKSLIIAVLASVFAFAFHLTPGAVTTQFGGAIDTVATIILNTAPGLWLIYMLSRIYQFILNIKTKIEATHLATGPPHP